jgi:uncharacterized membrane protein
MESQYQPDENTRNQWQQDPSNWKWGIIYFNPKDKRIFPPKRLKGLGWTVNFANPLSVIAFIIIVVLFSLFFDFISHTSERR